MALQSPVEPGTVCTQKEPFSRRSLKFCIPQVCISQHCTQQRHGNIQVHIESRAQEIILLENNPALCHFGGVVHYYHARFGDGETEAQKESTVLGRGEVLQPHQAGGKSRAAPSHAPGGAQAAPRGPLRPTAATGHRSPALLQLSC